MPLRLSTAGDARFGKTVAVEEEAECEKVSLSIIGKGDREIVSLATDDSRIVTFNKGIVAEMLSPVGVQMCEWHETTPRRHVLNVMLYKARPQHLVPVMILARLAVDLRQWSAKRSGTGPSTRAT